MSTFNDLNIEEQVNFINSELAKNKSISVTKLCKKFGFNKSTVVSRFTTNGFTYNPKQRKYISDIKSIPVKTKDIDVSKVSEEKSINEKDRSEEHTSELQSRQYLVCRLLLEKKKNK